MKASEVIEFLQSFINDSHDIEIVVIRFKNRKGELIDMIEDDLRKELDIENKQLADELEKLEEHQMRIDMGDFEITQAGEGANNTGYLKVENGFNRHQLDIYTDLHVLVNLQRNVLYRKCKLVLEVEDD